MKSFDSELLRDLKDRPLDIELIYDFRVIFARGASTSNFK